MAEKFSFMAEYTLALLELLAEAGPLTTRVALETFERKYRDRIPGNMYGMTGKEIKWANRVRWERLNLARLGLMGNDQKGIWYITEKGRQFLSEHPYDALPHLQALISLDADRAKEERQKKAHIPATKIARPAVQKQPKPAVKPRQKRGDQLSVSTSFHINSELAPAHHKLDQEIQTIRDYLHGISALQPSNELLCDWVHFCYQFEFYTEGALLYPLISGEDVNSWYLERTRKLARLCSLKANQ